ncbi:MAG: hypothetical protein WC390_06785 [Sulfurimonas sp.]
MDKLIRNSTAEFLIFTSQSGENSIEVKVFDESVWLTQAMVAQLFDVQRPAVTKHLKNIFESGELDENSVSSILEHTANDGKIYNTKYYNLDAIISVGYRVNSKKIADEKAFSEFEKYRIVQDRLFMSDFDKLLLEMENKNE